LLKGRPKHYAGRSDTHPVGNKSLVHGQESFLPYQPFQAVQGALVMNAATLLVSWLIHDARLHHIRWQTLAPAVSTAALQPVDKNNENNANSHTWSQGYSSDGSGAAVG